MSTTTAPAGAPSPVAIGQEPTLLHGPDGPCFRWTVTAEDRSRNVDVYFSGTVAACDPDGLPSQVGEAVRTRGLSVIQRAIARELPLLALVTTVGIQAASRATIDAARPGEAVFVCRTDDPFAWQPAVVLRAGDPEDALIVTDPRVEDGARGPERRAVDVAWVSVEGDGVTLAVPYARLRRRFSIL